jgi:antitoxin (DNA-binding transcriptional repressor) of toxin-antitoxin stability system
MKLTFLDLRRRPDKLLKALERNEAVTLSRRGKDIAKVIPLRAEKQKSVMSHPAFGMWKDHPEMENPIKAVRRMRKGRYRDL